MKHSHKAQIEIQFNWIFVLIVGAIILAFFFIIITNQQEQATIEGAHALIQRLDTIFTTISKQPNTVETFTIPDATIEFMCEEDLSQYFIQGAGPIPTPNDIIFTPARLRGTSIITWTKEWSLPYDTATFTYMATERTLFIFTTNNPTDDTNKLYNDMPEDYRKVLVPLADLSTSIPRGYDRYVIIAAATHETTVETFLQTFEEREKTVARIIRPSSEGVESYGDVIFIPGINPSRREERHYYLAPSLWGAIFTEDENTYDCTMNKALKRLHIITSILEKRSSMIQRELRLTPCYTQLSLLTTTLQTILTNSNDLNNAEALYNAKNTLEQQATDTLRGYKCPYLY